VDGKGEKISKSKGNYVPAEEIINREGAELLRLWVAATDYTSDIRISKEILTRLSESYRKIRNTLRFMLGNLHPEEFAPAQDLVGRENLALLDRYILARFSQLIARVRHSYEQFDFHVVFHALNDFVTVELSSFYLDVIKDTLYCEGVGSPRRKSAQTALYHLTRGMLSLLAPILSFTAEEAWSHLPREPGMPRSVHLSELPVTADGYEREDTQNILSTFERLLAVRAEVQRAMEPFRASGRHPLEAKVILSCPFELRDFLGGFLADLPSFFIASQVELREQDKGNDFMDAQELVGLRMKVVHADGVRCARCWVWSSEVGTREKHPALCHRCSDVVG